MIFTSFGHIDKNCMWSMIWCVLHGYDIYLQLSSGKTALFYMRTWIVSEAGTQISQNLTLFMTNTHLQVRWYFFPTGYLADVSHVRGSIIICHHNIKNIIIPCSHIPPMNPAAQVQENLLTPSSQVAPLIHGLLAHSSTSTKKLNAYIYIYIYICLSCYKQILCY